MLDRRNILKFLLAGAAGTMLTPLPWKLLEDSALWTQNWPWLPAGRKGEVTFRRTASKLCPSGSGMRVQLVGGLPVRLLPDPGHPLSLGGISALALAETQLLYSPARVRAPLRRGGDGILRPVSPQAALDVFIAALQKIQKQGKPNRLLCLCGDENGSMPELLSLLLHAAQSQEFYFMPSELQPHAAAALAAGVEGLPCYKLEESDFIVCLGADILDSWGTIMRNNHICCAEREPGEKPQRRLVYCGPARNATALAAERWIALTPGDEAIFLLGLANLLRPGVLPPEAAAYTPEKVSAATGVSLAAMRVLAREINLARRPLIITGCSSGQGGSALSRLGFAFNELIGNAAQSFLPGPEPFLEGASKFTDLARRNLYARALAGGAAGEAASAVPDLLISYDANPIYALPGEVKTRLRLADIPLKVAFSSFLDESALAADLVFPLPLGLERLDDIYTPFGSGQIIYSFCPQIIPPAPSLTPPGKILFAALTALEALPRATDGTAVNDFESLLKGKALRLGANFRELLNGKAFTAAPHELRGESFAAFARDIPLYSSIVPPESLTRGPAQRLVLAPLTNLDLGTPPTGIPPYSSGLLLRDDLRNNELVVRVNVKTARRLNLAVGQRVRLSAEGGAPGSFAPPRLFACLDIFEGIMDNALGLPLGYGHAAFADYGLDGGANGLELYSLTPERSDDPTAGAYASVRGLKLERA